MKHTESRQDWDREVDFLVAGTGIAGMSAAITAELNGLDTLVIESMDKWGGTTAISGGGLWLPNNPLEFKDGVQDSTETAFDYLQSTVGDVGPWTSDARKWAFINAVPSYVNLLSDQGIKWTRAKKYPDYYPVYRRVALVVVLSPCRLICESLVHLANSFVKEASRRRFVTTMFNY